VGPDNKLYIQLGQPYNVPAKEKNDAYRKLGLGGVIRMDRDGKNREVFALGLRNPVGMDFNPKDKSLWTNDNQVDGMGDDIPAGEMNRVTAVGQDFGFPWYGGGRTRTNEYKTDTPPANVIFPEVNKSLTRRTSAYILHRHHVPEEIPGRDLRHNTARGIEPCPSALG
jgi:glucose/arabinose dehydrogenase